MTIKVLEIDCATNNVVERKETAQEKLQREQDQIKRNEKTQAQAEALEAKITARQAVLDKLGLTADEAAALLG